MDATTYTCSACGRQPAHTAPTTDCDAAHPLMERARQCLGEAVAYMNRPVVDDATTATNAKIAVVLSREAADRLQSLWVLILQ